MTWKFPNSKIDEDEAFLSICPSLVVASDSDVEVKEPISRKALVKGRNF